MIQISTPYANTCADTYVDDMYMCRSYIGALLCNLNTLKTYPISLMYVCICIIHTQMFPLGLYIYVRMYKF